MGSVGHSACARSLSSDSESGNSHDYSEDLGSRKSNNCRLKRSSHSKHRRRSRSKDHEERKKKDNRDHRSTNSRRKDRTRPKSRHHDYSGSSPRKKRSVLLEEPLKSEESADVRRPRFSEKFSQNLGYTDIENPFGDSSLTSTFVWIKKKHGENKHLDSAERRRREEERRRNGEELEKLKRRRDERELEMQLREKEQLRLQRERDMMETGNWELNENSFYFEQTKMRTLIRAKEDRVSPIDVLAINMIIAYDEKIAQQFFELGVNIVDKIPYTIFECLSLKNVEELHKDIQNWIYLDDAPDSKSKPYWEALLVVSEMELEKRSETQNPPMKTTYAAVNSSIVNEIDMMLKDKTLEELDVLQNQIKKKLSGGDPVDTEYWEVAIKLLIVWKAKLTLRTIHKVTMDICHKKMKEYEQQNRMPDSKVTGGLNLSMNFFKSKPETVTTIDDDTTPDFTADSNSKNPPSRDHTQDESDSSLSTESYNPEMSPELWQIIPVSDYNIEVIDFTVFAASLKQAREGAKQAYMNSVEATYVNPDYGMPSEYTLEQSFLDEAAESMDIEDNSPTDLHMEPELVTLPSTSSDSTPQQSLFQKKGSLSKPSNSYYWYDRYRSRKPRYLNRVHTGYEWNKYNQTHYDSDNPPPKVIQGYKFNIFYPDLIERNISPTYVREKDPDNPETCTLRFKAGPPYEDIAFRIINREWEYSHKRGFRSSFDKGVLQLWFHFKRHYYRR